MTDNQNFAPQPTDPEHFFRDVYGSVDQRIRNDIVEQIGGNLPEHVQYLEQYGVTKLSGLFSTEQVARMQADMAVWRTTKELNRDRQVGFDGGRREAYLPTSVALSEAVTHPAIWATVAATFGQHPRLASVSTYSIDPVGPDYQEAFPFQWHHDGSSEYGIRAMILISDVPGDGQAMRICPGTSQHRWPAITARETQFDSGSADNFEQYVCSGRAGDVFIFNPHALHRGTRNATVRRDVTAVYFQPGIARNFQLPGLHPSVTASLSPYQQSVYRVGEESMVEIDESTLPETTAINRETMSSLAAAWSMPVEQITDVLDASGVDERIALLGELNRQRLELVVPSPKELIDQADVFSLRAAIQAYAPGYSAFLLSSDAPAYAEYFHTAIHDEWQSDFNGELDLPIRMYNPSRDQQRDEAMFSMRSRSGEPILMKMAERLSSITPDELAAVNIAMYEQAVDPLLEAGSQFLDTLQDVRIVRQAEAQLRFAEDIQEMLHRAHSIQLVRRTLLFAYLTYANMEALCVSAPGANVTLLEQLATQKEHTLRQYAGVVAFSDLTRR